jgi:arsenite methyltransferase
MMEAPRRRSSIEEDEVSSEVHQVVRDHYAAEALRVTQQGEAGCGEPGCCSAEALDPISRDLYSIEETATLPVDAVVASLGCGNPTALTRLQAGEVVLDLGSGGGIDVLLSARRVGPSGHVYGLDMTEEMLELARANAVRAGASNVTFLQGTIEDIPLPDASVDVVISNCVINLAGDKARVLQEAFRVLRPGGRFAVSDIVTRRELPTDVRRSMELWAGCVAGALSETEFVRLLTEAGFVDASTEITRPYTAEDAADALAQAGMDPSRAGEVDGALASAFVRARKPAAGSAERGQVAQVGPA